MKRGLIVAVALAGTAGVIYRKRNFLAEVITALAGGG